MRIGEVDRLIDRVVYKHYGLTEAEVTIVEASLSWSLHFRGRQSLVAVVAASSPLAPPGIAPPGALPRRVVDGRDRMLGASE